MDHAFLSHGLQCSIQLSLRVLRKAAKKGKDHAKDEMELDGVVLVGDDMAYILSHKGYADDAKTVKDIRLKADTIERNILDPAYAGSNFLAFRGRKIVPVFMAESRSQDLDRRLMKLCRESNIKLGLRNGRNITIVASLIASRKELGGRCIRGAAGTRPSVPRM